MPTRLHGSGARHLQEQEEEEGGGERRKRKRRRMEAMVVLKACGLSAILTQPTLRCADVALGPRGKKTGTSAHTRRRPRRKTTWEERQCEQKKR
eukprot:8524549-Pyramimonas_sp.AAC.1